MIANIFIVLQALLSQELDDMTRTIFIFSIAFSSVIYIGFFVMRAVATCIMSKRRKVKNWWLGMIPYVNFYALGKLSGPVRIFKIDVKNIGLWVAISAALIDAITLFDVLGGTLLLSFIPILAIMLELIYGLCDLVFIISYFSLAYALFGKYAPAKRLLYSALCLIQPAFSILLIMVMKKKPYDSFNDYYNEMMAKRYGQSYNPYAKPYSSAENPFDEYGSSSQKPEDPFGYDDCTSNAQSNGKNQPVDFNEDDYE